MKFESQLQIVTAAGVPPFTVNQTAAVINLNADLLDGQHGSFYQNAGNLNAGTLLAARLPAFTGGDVTSTAGTVALTLANSGVGAGTYRSVTVDAKGRVTAGTNPTTLAGYGITDALNTGSSAQTKTGNLTLSGVFTQTGEMSAVDALARTHVGNVEAYYQLSRRLQAFNHLGSTTVLEVEAMTFAGGGYGGPIARTTWRLSSRGQLNVTRHDENGGVAQVVLKVLNETAVPDANGQNAKYAVGLICGSTNNFLMVYLRARFLEYDSSSRWVTIAQMATATPTTQSGSAMTYSSGWVANTGFADTAFTEAIVSQKASQLTLTATTGTAPLVVTSTTTVANLNSDLLDGQHGAYFESRDATALGFSGGTLTLTRAAGNLTVSLDGRYLPLTGGTLTGELTIATGAASGLRVNSPAGTQGFWLRVGYDTDGTATPVASAVNTMFQSSGSSSGSFTFVCGNTKVATMTTGALNSAVALQQGGNQVVHAGNVSTYALPIGGGTLAGNLTINGHLTMGSGYQHRASDGSAAAPGYSFSADTDTGIRRPTDNSLAIVTAGVDRLTFGATGVATFSGQIASSVATGTAPLSITSTTLVTNLNADYLDGLHGSFYRDAGNLNAGTIPNARLPVQLQTESVSTTSITSGVWYTIATNIGDRATARFVIVDLTSGWHQSIHFVASTHFATGNQITVLQDGSYGGGGPIRYIRIKTGTTYDGALLQIYVRAAATDLRVYMLDDVQQSGWVIKNFIADGTNPGGVNVFANLTNVTAQVDLDNAGPFHVTGDLFIGGATTQYLALHAGNYNSYSPTLTGTGASGTWGISITGSAAQLNGQAASYYENRDTTAVGFSAGTLTLTRAAGNLAVSLDGRYLPLSGGTMTGRTVVSVGSRTTSYTGSNLEVYTGDNTPPGISFHRGGYSATLLYENDGELYVNPWTTRGQTGKLLAAGNYQNYALPLTGGTITGQLSVNGTTASDILRLYITGSTVWKLGVTDASGSLFNITADFGNFTINKTNGNVTTPGAFVGGNFSGPGTGLTGTAASLNIGGTAAIATNIADGAVSTTAKIANSVVTYAKIQNVAVARVLGNSSASVAQAPQEITMATLAGMLSGQTMNISGSATSVPWSGVTGKPTTLAGYGITDALDTSGAAQTKSGNLTVNGALTSGGAFYAAKTVQYSNRQQIYTVYYGGAQDLNWKKIANVIVPSGLYRGVTFKIDVVDNQGNFGWNSNCFTLTYFASCIRSGGVQDDFNNATVTGPVADYVRVVKTATGVYELQIRQIADWQTYIFTAEATINSGGCTVTYVTSPVNGSTTGTIYTATATAAAGWTSKLANIAVAGVSSFGGQITSTVATGTAPLSITSTTLVANLNSDLLDGQHGSYFENRDTTAVGFASGTLTLTRAAGNLAVSLDGRYLPLAGGTTSGAVTFGSTVVFGSSGKGRIYADWAADSSTRSFFAGRNSTDTDWNWGAEFGWDGANQRWYFDTVPFINGNSALHAGNYSSYALPLTGGTLTGALSVTGAVLTETAASSWGVYSKTAGVANYSGIWFSSNVGELLLRNAAGSLTTRISADGSYAFINNQNILHAGNVSTYALPIAGGTVTGNLSVSGTLTATGITYANGGLQATAGTFTGALIVNNDNGVRASYDNGGSFAWLYGYGVEFGRTISYVRPNTNRSATLFVGGPAINNNDWLNIDFYSSGRFTINNNAILHAGNYTSYAPNINGGSTIAGITYFSNGESMQVYGIRGRFTNEYLHLYNKVGVGHPGGWGQGEGSTPDKGLSTYGGINVAYGNSAASTFNGAVNVTGALTQSNNQVLHAGNYISSYIAPETQYTTPADASGYVWIRIPYAQNDSFNGGQSPIEFYVTRSIYDNSSTPYGGPTAKFVIQSQEWHSGQQMGTVQYGERGDSASGGAANWITHAKVVNQSGGGYWIYMRLRTTTTTGVTYRFRLAATGGRGISFPSIAVTTDPTGASQIFYGFNLISAGNDARFYRDGNVVLDVGNFAASVPNSGVTAGTYNNVTVNAKGIVTGGSNVAYLTGNQSITLGGDLSGSGTTSISATIGANAVTTTKINNSAVTYAKIQNVAVSSVLGNSSASVAQAPQALSMATLASLLSGQTMNIAGSSTSCTGNAATATNGFTVKPAWAGNQNLIVAISNLNNSLPSGFYEGYQAANSPTTGTWYNLINVRHSNTGNDHGFQLAMSYYNETLWSRSYQGGTGANNGTFTTWRAHLHSGNFSSYALPLTGGTLTGALTATSFSGAGTGLTGTAASLNIGGSAGSVAASGITGQVGMWTSAARPGPYRLYRRDADDGYSVQTYWTGSRWRLYGYLGDTAHADTHVGYADSAGSASSASSATNSTQLNGQAASYYENRDTTAVGISAGTLTLTRAAGNLTTTIGGRVVAWCEFNGNFASTGSPNAAFNVSSITKNATGDYTINFTSALANTNYVVAGYARVDTTNNTTNYNLYIGVARRSTAKTTTSCRIGCEWVNSTLFDAESVGVAFIAA